nr:hypothetical protein [uncultured Prevotella sp.]
MGRFWVYKSLQIGRVSCSVIGRIASLWVGKMGGLGRANLSEIAADVSRKENGCVGLNYQKHDVNDF